jgi:DNA-binding NarL/FixJ family response regulator
VSPELTAALIERISEMARMSADPEDGAGGTADLTSREHEILEMIGQGLTNQQIAGQLFIEIGTVKNHVHSILQKLNVSRRRDAAAYLAFLK